MNAFKDVNQSITGSNNSQIAGDHNRIYNGENFHEVSYAPLKESRFDSLWKYLFSASGTALSLLFIAITTCLFTDPVTQLAEFASVAQTSHPIKMIGLFFQMPGNEKLAYLDVIIIFFSIWCLFLIIKLIYISVNLLINKHVFFWGKSYTWHDDSSVTQAEHKAKCSVATCSGIINVVAPFENEENHKFPGRCNRYHTHNFNFDPFTLKGDRTSLTRKKRLKIDSPSRTSDGMF